MVSYLKLQHKVKPAEVALLRQLESIQDPTFITFLKSNLTSSKCVLRDRASGNEDGSEPSQV